MILSISSKTNEADSTKWVMQKLSEIECSAERKAKCANMILATKSHELSEENDTNYLTDVDLAILGTNQYDYQKYTEQIKRGIFNLSRFYVGYR